MRTEMFRRIRRASALAAVAVAAAAAAVTVPGSSQAAYAAGDCTPTPTWGTVHQEYVARILQLVNDDRARLGLQPLAIAQTLTKSAVWKAMHMAGYGYMAHEDPAPPVARTVGERLLACGYPADQAGWGENI